MDSIVFSQLQPHPTPAPKQKTDRMPTNNPTSSSLRLWLVRWLYAVVAGHLLVGLVLAWASDAQLFEAYHRMVENVFWQGGVAPTPARAAQVWWIALFGAAVQSTALWMAALVHLGDRHHSATAWVWLLGGLALWAPQDMVLSIQAQVWVHVWVDCFALLVLVPPLVLLWWHDRQPSISA